MTYVGLFEEVDLQDKVKKLKKELRKIKADKTRGQNDLERIIEEQKKGRNYFLPLILLHTISSLHSLT